MYTEHGMGEIVTAVLDAGLRLTMLIEHGDRLPLSYTLQAVKP